MTADPVMDLKKLADVHGEDMVKEILDSFALETTDLMGQMPSSLEAKDTTTVLRVAHQLKGLSAVCTAKQMQQLSLQLEQAVKNSDWDAAQTALEAMRQEHTKVMQFVKSLLQA